MTFSVASVAMSDAELNPVASSEISVASEENPPIDADVAFVTDQLIASIESLVEADRSIDNEPTFVVEPKNDGKDLNGDEKFVADDFQSKIVSDADGVDAPSSAADDETINDPLMKKLIENFSPTDVPHTYTNRKTGRIELRVKSSEWIREKILQMLNSNVNPDRFIKNVERNFGSKMLPLILEPNEFVQELVRALDGLEKNSRPYYLMCLMTEYCSAWPTKYHAPSPVFRPVDVDTGHSDVERRPNVNWRGRGQKFNSARNNLAFFHDQQKKPPPTKIAEDWEKYVWNQRPPTSASNVGDRRDEHFRQTYDEPQPLFPPSRYDNRYIFRFAKFPTLL